MVIIYNKFFNHFLDYLLFLFLTNIMSEAPIIQAIYNLQLLQGYSCYLTVTLAYNGLYSIVTLLSYSYIGNDGNVTIKRYHVRDGDK